MLTKERILEIMEEAGLDEKKFRTLMEKEEARLSPDELDAVTGGSFWELNACYNKFFERAGVTRDSYWIDSDTFKWNGKTYTSRDILLKDLKKAGYEPVRTPSFSPVSFYE